MSLSAKPISARRSLRARIGGELSFQFLSIRPFARAHMRLGVIIMCVLLKQADLRPISPENRSAYIHAAFQCLVDDSSRPLVNLWNSIIKLASNTIIPRYDDYQAGRPLTPVIIDQIADSVEESSSTEEVTEEAYRASRQSP